MLSEKEKVRLAELLKKQNETTLTEAEKVELKGLQEKEAKK